MKTIKEVSELTGISIRALRYYDEIGLLVPPLRSKGGYRLYDEKSVEKLNAILFLRELEVPLDTIKAVVSTDNTDYSTVLKTYRKKLVQKINRLQGLLSVLDSMESERGPIRFEGFQETDAEKVAETIVISQKVKDDNAISEIYELVKSNMVDSKIGNELLHIYGSKEKYLSAVEESEKHPEEIATLQEELKNIYFAFGDLNWDSEKAQELVKQLEENTKKLYRTSNARFMLLRVAEDYLNRSKSAQVLDSLYGEGVTYTMGKAINVYYGAVLPEDDAEGRST